MSTRRTKAKELKKSKKKVAKKLERVINSLSEKYGEELVMEVLQEQLHQDTGSESGFDEARLDKLIEKFPRAEAFIELIDVTHFTEEITDEEEDFEIEIDFSSTVHYFCSRNVNHEDDEFSSVEAHFIDIATETKYSLFESPEETVDSIISILQLLRIRNVTVKTVLRVLAGLDKCHYDPLEGLTDQQLSQCVEKSKNTLPLKRKRPEEIIITDSPQKLPKYSNKEEPIDLSL